MTDSIRAPVGFGSLMKNDNKHTFRTLLIIFASILFYVALQNTEKVSAIFSFVGGVLSPVFIGIAFAFILNIPLRLLEVRAFSRLNKKNKKLWSKLRRPVCLFLSVIIMFGVMTLVLLLIIPEVKDTVVTLATDLPAKAASLAKKAEAWLVSKNIPIDESLLLKVDWSSVSKTIISGVGDTGSAVVGFTSGVVGGVFNAVIGFALSIYFLAQKEKLSVQAVRLFRVVLPKKLCERVFRVFSMTCDTFSNFVTGQLFEALLIGVFSYLGMLVFRMPYAVMIAATISVTALIPVVGAIVGTTIGAVMILFVSPLKAVGFVVFIIVLQQIDNNFVYPKVVGTSVGLPGIWVLLSVTVGGSLFGAVGMLVSVPVCAVCYNLLREFVIKKENAAKMTDADIPKNNDSDASLPNKEGSGEN